MADASDKSKEPRRASTVILAREKGGEVQVYLLKRSDRSAFFPGNYVFPGGMVEPEDWDTQLWKAHVDMDLEGISKRLGGTLTEEETLAHGVAGIRETFEEAGVLLADRNKCTREDLERVRDRRMARDLPRGWFQDRVVSEGWTLTLSRLARWAHWITPKLMLRRYDTRFFLAFMPPGQECIADTRETEHGIWISPWKGLANNLRGEIPLSPPTLITLHELLQYPDMGDLEKEVKTRPWGEARLPRLIRLPKGVLILQPWDPMCNQELEIDHKGLEKAILPLGEPFSRLWYHEGIWRPVGNPERKALGGLSKGQG